MKVNWLILYDISNPKRLRKVSKLLEGEGLRVQKSLFECTWDEAHGILMESKLKELVDLEKDYILSIPRCQADLQKAVKIGKGSDLVPDTLPYKVL